MSEGGWVERVDLAIADFFATGNGYTFVLGGALVLVLLWPIIVGKEPDIHPYILARQAQASPVRQPGESAVYRVNEIPIGYPLRSGLGVKEPDAPSWKLGRNGDLRDVWKRAVTGPIDSKDSKESKESKDTAPLPPARLLTILGREKVIESSMKDVTQGINAIGQFLKEKGSKNVAICLSNSVEQLAIVFATAYYGLKPIMVPYGLDQASFDKLLSKTSADALVAEAGTLDVKSALSAAPGIKQVIWVAKEGSKHIDWNEVPEGANNLTVSTWHELVRDRRGSPEVPTWEAGTKTEPVAFFVQGKGSQYDYIEYTPGNIVAGIGGMLTTLVRSQRINGTDTLLSVSPLTETYAFCWTMAALFQNASIALNSVAGDSVDLSLAAISVSPTIIVASAGTITKYAEKLAATPVGLVQKISNYFTASSLRAGHMSRKKPSSVEPNLSKVRVLLVAQRDSDETKIRSKVLAGLRLALGTRVSYALTSPRVAGAVTQTNVLDYRDKGNVVNVGVSVSSVELYLVGPEDALDQDLPQGKIVVRGPAVVGNKVELGISARIEDDRTITLL